MSLVPLSPAERPRRGASLLILILAAGLLQGLLYMFLVPPWQHYDEPGHFEFAWLLSDRLQLPEEYSYNQAMRREVAASMMEHNFFAEMSTRPNLLSTTEPVWIGVSQINSSLLYYGLVALPLRLLRYTDVTFQLYIARLVSLLLYLMTLTAAYSLVAELTPSGHPLRFLVPATLVLLPGFVDMMTAVSDDVGATAFFSVFLWVAIHILRRGFSWRRALFLALSAAACALTKVTVAIAVPLAVLALVFSLFAGARQRTAWLVSLAAGLAVILAVLSWGDAAHWARQTTQTIPTRVQVQGAPLGDHAFQVVTPEMAGSQRMVQLLTQGEIQRLRGRTVTLGAWMWAAQPARARLPVLSYGDREVAQDVDVGVEPAFYAFQVKVDKRASRLYLALAPSAVPGGPPVTIYYDGVTLVEGKRDVTQPPRYEDASAKRGKWGGRPFTNLLENPSAETAGPWVRPWAERLVSSSFPGQPSLSLALSTVIDWAPASWYYQMAAKNLFQTFWARFGWGHVPLLGGGMIYKLLAAACLAGLAGVLLALSRVKIRRLPWPAILLLALAGAGLWFPAFMRGIDSLVSIIFMPAARYAFPAIIPTLLFLNAGWVELLGRSLCRFKIPVRYVFVVYSLSFFGLDILAIASLLRYYY